MTASYSAVLVRHGGGTSVVPLQVRRNIGQGDGFDITFKGIVWLTLHTGVGMEQDTSSVELRAGASGVARTSSAWRHTDYVSASYFLFCNGLQAIKKFLGTNMCTKYGEISVPGATKSNQDKLTFLTR
jgi:hypothetical protein